MTNCKTVRSHLTAIFAALALAGCGSPKPTMPVTPIPGAGAPGAGPQAPAAPGAVATPASAPSVKPR